MSLSSIFNFLLPVSMAIDTTCDFAQNLQVGTEYFIYNREYPEPYKIGTNCRWTAKSPQNTRIVITCPDVNIPPSANCQNDFVSVSLSGDPKLADAQKFCGTGTINLVSDSNSLTLGLFSSWYSSGGRFACSVTAIQGEENSEPTTTTTPRPNNCDCGWRKQRRIVGGVETGINEFSYMAAIIDLPSTSIHCGATVISTRYALTASHCLTNKLAMNLGILVGDHDILSGDETGYAALYVLEKFTVHPNYDARNSRNDIAVLKTQNVMEFSEGVGPVCLPFKYTDRDFAGERVTILGWGTTEFSGPKSDVLLAANVSVVPNFECRARLSDNEIFNSQICTYAAGRDSCQYDSGGPVVFSMRRNKRDLLLGVISYGLGCGSTLPSVNTRVSSYLAWVVSVTSDSVYCIK